MPTEHEHHPKPSEEKHWWLSLRGLIVFIFIIAVGYYLSSFMQKLGTHNMMVLS